MTAGGSETWYDEPATMSRPLQAASPLNSKHPTSKAMEELLKRVTGSETLHGDSKKQGL